MSALTISTELDESEARELDTLAHDVGLDRPALLQQIIRRGCREMQLEHALQAYRDGRVTLSRAAEMTGLGVRDLLLLFPKKSVELNYDQRELRRELEGA